MIIVDDLKTELALNSQTQKSMLEQLKRMEADLRKQIEDQAKYHTELMDRLDTKYASKWVERTIIFIWSAVWITIIWALMALIIKK